MSRLPPWIRLTFNTGTAYGRVHRSVRGMSLHTVCESARCPNINECWGRGTATFMLLGEVCTRNCAFCAVKAGKPDAVDHDEPRRVAEAAKLMNLFHAVLTSVARDDLPDGGASIFAATIYAIRKKLPRASIEVLTPDFGGNEASLNLVFEAHPDVFNHNLETVQRLQPIIRPQASYGRSLSVLKHAAEWQPELVVKSGVMLGLGETDDEVIQALEDLLEMGVRLLTIGQYLQPSRHHPPVQRYPTPDEFRAWEEKALKMGFSGVASGPLVRSSYRADELLQAAKEARGNNNRADVATFTEAAQRIQALTARLQELIGDGED